MAFEPLAFVNRVLLAVSNTMARIPDFTRRHRKKALLSLILLTIFFGAGIPKIKMDMSMEAFFREGDPTLHNFDVFKYLFGSDQFLMLMFQPADGDVFSPESLKNLKSLEDELNQERLQSDTPLNRITRVRSIYSADFLEATEEALINRKFIGEERMPLTQQESDALRALAMKQKDYPGQLFSEDSELGILMIQTDYASRHKGEDNADTVMDMPVGEMDIDMGAFGGFEDSAASRKPTGLLLTPDQLPEYERVDMEEYSRFMDAFNEVLQMHDWQHQLSGKDGAVSYLAVGNPWMMDLFNKVVMKEMGLFSMLSIILIVIILFFTVGSLAGMLWPTLLVGVGIIWTLGIVGWSGVPVNMMINITVFLILTVGVAAAIHILSVFKQLMERGMEEHTALTETLRKTGLPIMLAALTTIAGMLSMMVIPIAPIKAFAMFASIGVFVTFWLTVIYLPTLMEFWSPIHRAKGGEIRQKRTDQWLQSFLEWVYHCGRDYPKRIIAIFLTVTVVAMLGIPRVFIDTNIVTLIKPGVGVQEAISAIDNHFGGSSTAEVLIDTGRPDGIKDPQVLQTLDRFQQHVIKMRPDLVTRVDSIVKLTKESYKNMTNGREENYLIPDDPDVLSQTLFSFESADPSTRKLFVDDEWQVARVTVQVETRGSTEYEVFNAEIKQWLDEYFAAIKAQNPKFNTGVTGSIPLMMEMTSFISKAQINSYILVIAVIACLLLIIFGSLRFGLLAMIPNVLPILMIMGITGWMGIPLDTDTLLVMPIAIGIAVDDSIHFLTHYRTELLRGKSSDEAIHSAMVHVGQAMFYTSIVLSVGFLVFILSVHAGMTNFGILSSIAMFTALLADVFLLPAMIYVFKPFEGKNHLTPAGSAA